MCRPVDFSFDIKTAKAKCWELFTTEFFCTKKISVYDKKRKDKALRLAILLLVPTKLTSQWITFEPAWYEFERFTSEFL